MQCHPINASEARTLTQVQSQSGDTKIDGPWRLASGVLYKLRNDLIYYEEERFKRLVHERESRREMLLMDSAMCR